MPVSLILGAVRSFWIPAVGPGCVLMYALATPAGAAPARSIAVSQALPIRARETMTVLGAPACGPVLMEGWAFKRGPTIDYKWMRRWCVLRPGALEYYADDQCAVKKGVVPLPPKSGVGASGGHSPQAKLSQRHRSASSTYIRSTTLLTSGRFAPVTRGVASRLSSVHALGGGGRLEEVYGATSCELRLPRRGRQLHFPFLLIESL